MEDQEKEPGFVNTIYDESSIDPEILPAVRALRNAGIETIASNSGIGQIGTNDMWGSYIQILLPSSDNIEIAKKIDVFAKKITPELQEKFQNPGIFLQLVSAEKWLKDTNTTSVEIDAIPVFRLQLIGCTRDEEISGIWKIISKRFNPSDVA
ncbi:MAG TPA: hypothetical protein VJH63_01335 [Candidatus Paceibacterota bacterium]